MLECVWPLALALKKLITVLTQYLQSIILHFNTWNYTKPIAKRLHEKSMRHNYILLSLAKENAEKHLGKLSFSRFKSDSCKIDYPFYREK